MNTPRESCGFRTFLYNQLDTVLEYLSQQCTLITVSVLVTMAVFSLVILASTAVPASLASSYLVCWSAGADGGLQRYGLGSALMFGVTPQYLAMWLVWRGASIAMPDWLYQWGDDKLYSLYQRLVLFFFETCTGVEVMMYGDTEQLLQRKENILYFANHQSTVDWMVADMVSVRGGNIGHLRYVMKNTLQLIPLYGWYFYEHGCIYVRRGKFNQDKMMRSLDYLKSDRISTWLVIFPEGTRYYPSTPAVIEKSEQYAKANNLTVLRHHLVPKHRGTWLAVQHLQEKLDAVYDVSVFYEGSVDSATGMRRDAPQLVDFLMGRCRRVHIKVRRIPFKQVPKSEDGLKVWLHELFVEKDRLLRPFFTGLHYEECRLAASTLGSDGLAEEVMTPAKSNGGPNGLNVTDDRKAAVAASTSSPSLITEDCSLVTKANGTTDTASSNSAFNRKGNMICSSEKESSYPSSVLFKTATGLDYDAVIRRYGGTRSRLGIWETLPSFLLFSGISISCVYFPWARKAYFNLLCYGTLGAYVWLAVRNVC